MELVSTGIVGLDEMLGGGIPKSHIMTVMGTFGTGKTTMALQFTWEGLQRDEKCIFITLEETVDSMLSNAGSFGWDLRKYMESKRLGLVKLEPADAKTTLTRIKSELPSYIKSFGASRIAVDSVSLLNMMFQDEMEKRAHLFDLYQQIKSTGATALFTSEVKDQNAKSSRDGLVEYVSDGVILLQFDEPKGSDEVRLVLQIIKVRRREHSRTRKPYSITKKGIVVHTKAEVF